MGNSTNTIQYGASYEFGVNSSDAPSVPGLNVTKISVKDAPEVFAKSQNGEGKTDSITVDQPDKFDFEVTVSGRIFDLAAYRGSGSGAFSWRDRYFVVNGREEPRDRGAYVEGQVGAISTVLVTGPAS